jgi:hypothetical protein
MTKDEALKLALEALEGIHPGNMTPMAEEYWNKAITAIKQALAASVQEPFCFVYVENGEEYFAPKNAYVPDNAQPLYTTPPAAPDLQAELDATNRQVEILSDALAESRRGVAAPVQEPVAWVCFGAPEKRDIDFEEADINGLPIGTLLYTSPPAQPMHPEIKKMYEDYFDKCFRESSAAAPENLMDALRFDAAVRDVDAMIALARADERESCAKVCDDMVLYTGYDCAAAIRARRKNDPM